MRHGVRVRERSQFLHIGQQALFVCLQHGGGDADIDAAIALAIAQALVALQIWLELLRRENLQ